MAVDRVVAEPRADLTAEPRADLTAEPRADLTAEPRDAKVAANWVINELFGRLNKEGLQIDASPVSTAQLGSHHRYDRFRRHLRQDRQGRV